MNKVKGAEATVEILDGKVVKRRKPKKYRHDEIDEKIRKDRTDTELDLIEEARRHNVSVPEAERIDASTLEMKRIKGKQLKEVLNSRPKLMEEYGENVALLHSTNVTHGDLTTSNAILSGENNLYLIDFGLSSRSKRIEDKAVDIHLLKQVIESSHPEIYEDAWKSFTEGYRSYEMAEEVLKQLEEVEGRGRYK